ncbi:MraY family glycosyltransferase [Selenomonas montiformis]|uniref:Undecaprenyl/decaprenyl-phosphate alpha-N-acetylglucosaminyl 1-phosphate transferase n=1 Tax=Selenomonas montiformis TaxID=2652285 RepID=A0A6I2UX36_9FIRM|nr:MraY family glycosyltransferase [Selenomonas montiformis]MDY4696650.1 MraY family glycosyltransferase [Selenomonas montiformis]MSV23832.1 undecaprenyl/decaprenyl-phosphate alpha-N-acetylglucosaminyl 1-phosphate transferase [Selenomonas montiformis]
MPDYMLAFVIAAGVALLITPGVIFLAARTGAMDAPDARKVHKKPIPRIGGIGIYAAFMAAIFSVLSFVEVTAEVRTELIGLMVGGSLIVLVGVIDDYKNLPAKVKLVGQILAAAVLVIAFDVRIDFITDPFGDYIYTEWLAIPVTIFWIVGLTNTVNLIDGLDGLAAGVSTIASITIFLVALQQGILLVAVLTAALAGAAFGFLYYNFNPARIFMGDSGSMFLGYMLAGISVIGAVKSAATIALIVPILALGLPILDTTFAIVRRYRGGVPIFKPDKGHLHHRLLDLGFSQRQAVLLMYVISALLGLSAVALTEVSSQFAILIVCVVVAAVLFGAKKIGIFHMNHSAHQH